MLLFIFLHYFLHNTTQHKKYLSIIVIFVLAINIEHIADIVRCLFVVVIIFVIIFFNVQSKRKRNSLGKFMGK